MRVTIAPYDPSWRARYETHRERIANALGKRVLRIEHIGSTAVPGFPSKRIVDVLVQVAAVRDAAVDAAFAGAGYELRVDDPEHRMYATPERDAHVHLWSGPDDVERHLLFRDWLRADAADRELYLHVKTELAKREWVEQNDYAQAKSGVVNAILRRARGERRGPRTGRFAGVIERFTEPPARVLEIGAGEGLLAARLAQDGYKVVAIDRTLRSLHPIVESSFEEYDAPDASFDCIASQLVLHHVHDLEAALRKIAMLLAPGGILAIDDYGWERSGDAAFRSERSDLHRGDTMLAALRSHFREVFYDDHAYFDEGAGSDELGFTFVGRSLSR